MEIQFSLIVLRWSINLKVKNKIVKEKVKKKLHTNFSKTIRQIIIRITNWNAINFVDEISFLPLRKLIIMIKYHSVYEIGLAIWQWNKI